jgi:hypothetical protein
VTRGQLADSPPSPKRTRLVDVETGLIEDVIAAVPLRSAAPSAGAGGGGGDRRAAARPLQPEGKRQ